MFADFAAEVLLEVLQRLCQEKQVKSFTELTKDIQFYPDFHGTLTVAVASISIFLFLNRKQVTDR